MRANKLTYSSAIRLQTILELTIFGLILIAVNAFAASSDGVNKGEYGTPSILAKAIGCLVADKSVRLYGLDYLGLKVDDWAWARYTIGTIPGIEKTPRLVNVILYATDGNRGMLLFAYPNKHGSFDAVANGYRLEKRKVKWIPGANWVAGYGNGGYVDYIAISRYATRLEQKPRYRVHLVPGGSNCGSLH